MADRRSIWVLVAIVVLAGCTGPMDPTPKSPSPSPTPAPSERLPPGVNTDGIGNASALLAAHVEALTATGYVATGAGSSTIRRQGFLVRVQTNQRSRVGSGGSAYRTHRTVTAGPVDRERTKWANGTPEFRRIRENNEVRYARGPPDPADELAGSGLLRPYLRGGNYTLVESRRSADGWRHTLEATSVGNRTAVFEALPRAAEEVTSFEATVVVDDRGRVHSMEATVDYVISGRTETQRMSFSVDRTGNVSIAPPDWIDTARNRTASG